jgi:uncharacterized protein (UPF0297 family)
VSEVHLGKIIYGKTKGSARKNRSTKFAKKPKSEWIVTEGKHEILKTQDEHEHILLKLQQYRLSPPKSRAGLTPVSGILYCKLCDYAIRFVKSCDRKGNFRHLTALCTHKFNDGNGCGQKGCICDQEFFDKIYEVVIKTHKNDLEESKQRSEQRQEYEGQLKLKQQHLQKINQIFAKLLESLEEEIITKQEYTSRKQAREIEKEKLLEEICNIELNLKRLQKSSDILKKIEEFKCNWAKATTNSEKNAALKQVVRRIWYNRVGDEVTFTVEYL